MIKKSILTLILTLVLAQSLPVFAEADSLVSSDSVEPVLVDGNAEFCFYIASRVPTFNQATCLESIEDGSPVTIYNLFSTPLNRPMIVKNVSLRIIGYNSRITIQRNSGLTIENSIISNAHGCVLTVQKGNSQNLHLISGTFSAFSNSEKEGIVRIPSPICLADGATEADLRSVLAENSDFYKPEADDPFFTLVSGLDPNGKIGELPIHYLASDTVVVKNTPLAMTLEQDPDQDSPTQEEIITIPLTPNTGKK